MRRVSIATVLVVLAIFVLSSCATTGMRSRRTSVTASEATSEQTPGATLKIGMTAIEVRESWGEPREVVKDPAAPAQELWVYESSKGVEANGKPVVLKTQYRLSFADGRLANIEEKPL